MKIKGKMPNPFDLYSYDDFYNECENSYKKVHNTNNVVCLWRRTIINKDFIKITGEYKINKE